jgi:hypothetical protein
MGLHNALGIRVWLKPHDNDHDDDDNGIHLGRAAMDLMQPPDLRDLTRS